MAFQRATRLRPTPAPAPKPDAALSAPARAGPATLPQHSLATLPIFPAQAAADPVRGGVVQLAGKKKKGRRPEDDGVQEDDDRSLQELQADLERLRAKPRREKVVSEQKPPKKKVRAKAKEQGWKSHQPVHGHEPAPLEDPTPEQSEAIETVQDSLAALSRERTRSKAATTAKVYRARAAFDEDASRKEIRKAKGGTKFLEELFGETGSYVPDLQAADVTSRKVLEEANRRLAGKMKLKAHNVATTGETRITHGGRHLYTLHRGTTAFKPVGRARDSGRQVLRQKGGKGEFVRDDRGVPTRRFAYAVKGESQVERLDNKETLRGRFLRPDHPAFGKAPRTIMSGSHVEIAELGRVPPQAAIDRDGEMRGRFGELSPDEMLYMHQEFGSSDRQRGVSISGSPTPLLSNEARGFADNPGAQKYRIDLGSVPRSGKKKAPNLINFHQRIRGMKHKRVVAPPLHEAEGVPEDVTPESYDEAALAGDIQPGALKYDQARQQRRFDWSVAKNRELFLSSLSQRNIRGTVPISDLERTRIPDDGIEEEIERVKTEAREGEAAIPKIKLKRPKAKTRKRRGKATGRGD